MRPDPNNGRPLLRAPTESQECLQENSGPASGDDPQSGPTLESLTPRKGTWGWAWFAGLMIAVAVVNGIKHLLGLPSIFTD